MDKEKLTRADELEREARKLRQEAFAERPLPDKWRVGQKVRTLRNSEFAWNAGAVMEIIEIHEDDEDKPLDRQVFYTTHLPSRFGRYWTMASDVELVEDVPATV